MRRFVTLVEVGPRDGLQNEPTILPTEAKIAFINRALDAGIRHIEAVSFVNPKKVPQMADAEAVMAGVPRDRGAVYCGLVLNRRGFDRAVAADTDGGDFYFNGHSSGFLWVDEIGFLISILFRLCFRFFRGEHFSARFRIPKRAGGKSRLLELVRVRRTRRRARGYKTADGREGEFSEKMLAEFFVQVTPRAHVGRFFLNPKRGRVLGVRFQNFFQKSAMQRIKLFEPDDRDVVALVFIAIRGEIEINFSGADQNAFYVLRF